MKRFLRLFLLCAPASVLIAGLAHGQYSEKELLGKWELTSPAADEPGQPCPLVPDQMEYFTDTTLIMSNMLGNRVVFKTTVTQQEREAIETRNPGLQSLSLLIKPAPRMQWQNTRSPMAARSTRIS